MKIQSILISVLLIFILLIVMGVSGCVQETYKEDVSSDTLNSSNITPDYVYKDCPKELIPNRMLFNCSRYEECSTFNLTQDCRNDVCVYIENVTYTFNDGIELHKANNLNLRQALFSGENTNYLYSSSYLIYNRIPISSDGTIEAQINHNFFIAVDPKDKTKEGYKVVAYKCQEYSREWHKI